MAVTTPHLHDDHPMFFSVFGGLWPDRKDAEAELARRRAAGSLSDQEAALFEQWIRNGYAVIEDAVPQDAVDAYNRDVDALFARPDPAMKIVIGTTHEIVPMARERITPENSVRIADHYVHSEAARQMLTAPPVEQFLTKLFEDRPLLFQSLGFVYGSQQGVHQDTAYVVTGAPMTIAGVWIAAEDVKPGSGELCYYRGSHRLPEYFFSGRFKHWKDTRDGETSHAEWARLLHENAAKMGLELETFRPKRGTALIWHSDLAHGGAPITAPGSTRRSLVGHFCPAQVQPLYFQQLQNRAVTRTYRGSLYATQYYDMNQPKPEPVPAPSGIKEGMRRRLGTAYAMAKQALPEPIRLGLKGALRAGLRGSPRAARLVTDYLPIDLSDPTAAGPQASTPAPGPGSTHDFWGRVVREEAQDPSPVEVDPADVASVHHGFLALNGLYLRLAASSHVSLSDQHVQQEDCYRKVLERFRASGLRMRDFAMDPARFEAYLEKSLPAYEAHNHYATNQGGLGGYFPQKALEHWISSEFLGWKPSDVILDFAAWISPAAAVLRAHRPAEFYKHDIMLKTDLAKREISGWSDAVEAPDEMFDVVMAHCSIDNFEKDYDTKFFKEVRRILKPGGRVLITPLHMSARFENRVALGSPGVAVDDGATLVLGPPGSLRFARLYDVDALRRRVIDVSPGLDFEVIHVTGLPLEKYRDTCTNHFMLLGTKAS